MNSLFPAMRHNQDVAMLLMVLEEREDDVAVDDMFRDALSSSSRRR